MLEIYSLSEEEGVIVPILSIFFVFTNRVTPCIGKLIISDIKKGNIEFCAEDDL